MLSLFTCWSSRVIDKYLIKDLIGERLILLLRKSLKIWLRCLKCLYNVRKKIMILLMKALVKCLNGLSMVSVCL